ncbi:hypothetical protein ISP15_16790 [Dyella jejuensis]|uniref:Secreted protein n=1 Tax=Dyella jejuensis TaxID=1432009 RepID=A0ABW8JLK7_9GAMM
MTKDNERNTMQPPTSAGRIRSGLHMIFCAALLGGFSSAASAQDTQHYEGTATHVDGHVIYEEEHFLFDDHGVRTRLVLYRCPSGQPFARKWVRDVPNAEAPDFDLVDARTGYREGVRGSQGKREIYVQADRDAPLRSAPLAEYANAVIDAGFDAYVRDHWNDLGTSSGTRIVFAVPSRLDYVALRLDDANSGARGSVRHLRLSMDAWYGFAVPSIELTYATADRRLLRFEGLSNIHDAAGKEQRVRIDFSRSASVPAPSPQDIQRAAALPLAQTCPG